MNTISLDEEIRKDKQTRIHYRRTEGYRKPELSSRYSEHRPTQKTLLRLNHLHYSVTREQLQQMCEQFGKVKICRIDWDIMGRSKETASVEYFSEWEAELAQKALQGKLIQGQQIKAELVFSMIQPPKRHEINKNFGKYRKNQKYNHRN